MTEKSDKIVRDDKEYVQEEESIERYDNVEGSVDRRYPDYFGPCVNSDCAFPGNIGPNLFKAKVTNLVVLTKRFNTNK